MGYQLTEKGAALARSRVLQDEDLRRLSGRAVSVEPEMYGVSSMWVSCGGASRSGSVARANGEQCGLPTTARKGERKDSEPRRG